MLKASKIVAVAAALLLLSAVVTGHPHFQKTTTCKVGNAEAKLEYFTAPANMEHVKNVKTGEFVKSFAKLTLGQELTVGGTSLPAGEYQVGAIKNSDNDWTMGLHKGALGFRDAPDPSKVIKLPSMFSKNHGKAAHIYFDISPGFGKFDGKPVLVWHFGDLYLVGALS